MSEDPFSEEDDAQSEGGDESSYCSYLSTNNTSKFNEFGDIDSDCEQDTKFNYDFDTEYLFGHFEDQLSQNIDILNSCNSSQSQDDFLKELSNGSY